MRSNQLLMSPMSYRIQGKTCKALSQDQETCKGYMMIRSKVLKKNSKNLQHKNGAVQPQKHF